MSALVGIFDSKGQLPSDAAVRAMIARMETRGRDHVQVWRGDGAVLAVARHGWECTPGFSGDALVVEDDRFVVAADASLYYQSDLQQRLADAGVRVGGSTPSHLLLAACRAWGAECAAALEGDFAFVAYDRARRTVIAARDFAGRRPLFYMRSGEALVLASAVAGITAYPGYREELNLGAVGAVAAGLLGAARESAYRGVFALRAGERLTRVDGGPIELAAHWDPPVYERDSGLGFDEAADKLRELICRATEERLAGQGPTTVWMSGGWDSTAVFAAGEEVHRRRGDGEHLKVVSISYPKGDPGREDELILDIARHWNRPVHWIDINDVPFFDGLTERAGRRDDPLAHVYENWNRALDAKSRELGAHVALDGMGGDGLFQVSPVYFADLFRAGRWPTLAREWRAKRFRVTAHNAWTLVVRHLLPAAVLGLVERARGGRRVSRHLERMIPPWITPAFAVEHGLEELTRSPVVRRPGESLAACETQWHLRTPWVPAILSCLSSMALEYGVEIRSPLYDRRVVEFAATRPRAERSQGGETKRLLRASMRGLLPDNVLAPRASRTGMTLGYFHRSMHAGLATVLLETFKESLLAESGVIDIKQFWQAAGRYLKSQDANSGVELFLTLQAELWLRAHARSGRAEYSVPGVEAVALSAGY